MGGGPEAHYRALRLVVVLVGWGGVEENIPEGKEGKVELPRLTIEAGRAEARSWRDEADRLDAEMDVIATFVFGSAQSDQVLPRQTPRTG